MYNKFNERSAIKTVSGLFKRRIDSGSSLHWLGMVRVWSIFYQAVASFTETRAAQASAGIAYYAFFSLFPLLLVLIVAGSFFLKSNEATQVVVDYISQVLPLSTDLLNRNINRVLELRASIGIISLISLLWSSTSVFSALAFNINLAWKDAARRNFIQKRLVGLAMVGVLAVLYVLFLIVTISVRSLPVVQAFFQVVPVLGSMEFVRGFNTFASWILISILYFALYRWVPATKVKLKPALVTALVATISWQIVTYVFTWFVRTGLSKFELIYGSLGTVVALLLVIYINAWIILFGAHLCAAIQMELAPNRSRR